MEKLKNINTNLPQFWKQGIQNQVDKNAIIKEMLSQITKDFAMFGHELFFDLSKDWSYNQIFQYLEKYLNAEFIKNTSLLYPILYRIDILEKDIQMAIKQQDDFGFLATIAHQVIYKETQKILIRRHYKAKSD